MPGFDPFAIQLRPAGLGSWLWEVIDRDGIVVSGGQSACQAQAYRNALIEAQSPCLSFPVDEAA